VTGLTGAYERSSDPQELLLRAGELSARTIIFDVEPLVAWWDGSQESLDQGVAAVVEQSRAIPGVETICFATNSARRPSRVPAPADVHVIFLASARKPVRIAPYRSLPRPGAVIGDQPATDGVLAHRLGYTFLHYSPPLADAPFGPRLMQYGGRLVVPFLVRTRPPRAESGGN
jgi:predicted HAD superfamily phosphohydrolase YqeG